MVNRLTGKRSILEIAGILTKAEGKEIRKQIEKIRKESRHRIATSSRRQVLGKAKGTAVKKFEQSETVAYGGEDIALSKVQRNAKTASQKEKKLLDNLEKYYKGDCSLEYVAEGAHVPLRAIMEFVGKNRLPYFSDKTDAEEGLKKISKIRLAF